MSLHLTALKPQIDEMAAQLADPEPKPVIVEDTEGTKVPQVGKAVGINVTFRYLYWGREWRRSKRRRVSILPGSVVVFWKGHYRPREIVEDGWRVFEAVERTDFERENGFGFTSMKEEDWQRLLNKAQRGDRQ